jgi:DNA-binding transcriptional LysR family regulator
VIDTWPFQEDGKRFEVTVSGALTTTSAEVVHSWVRAGRGIAQKAVWDVQPDLEAGTIVECLREFWCNEIDLFAVCASRQHLFPRVRVFRDFISAMLPEMVRKESRIGLQESSPLDATSKTEKVQLACQGQLLGRDGLLS